jgi:hypothetical protein
VARFERSHSWKRWEGRRRDITRAVGIASDAMSEWSGYPAACSVVVSFGGGLTERSDDPHMLDRLDVVDLSRIDELRIEVRPSRDAWRKALSEAQQAWRQRRLEDSSSDEPPPELDDPIDASVDFRFWKLPLVGAVTLEVEGPERERVEGLVARLTELLDRGAGPRVLGLVPRQVAAAGSAVALVIAALIVGPWMARVLGTAERNDRYDAGEIVGLVVGLVCAGLISLGLYWMAPQLEILDETREPRSRRSVRLVGGVLVALLLGILATAIYDVVWAD